MKTQTPMQIVQSTKKHRPSISKEFNKKHCLNKHIIAFSILKDVHVTFCKYGHSDDMTMANSVEDTRS